MEIIVLIKQVPEMDQVKFDAEKGVINRKSAGVEVNPFDLNALETAVRIKDKIGGKITAISLGPPRAEQALKEAVSRGADRGILLTDKVFSGSDTIATSKALSAAIRKVENFDLIIGGEMSVDGDTSQVGPQTAEYLGIPHIAYVVDIENIKNDSLVVNSSIWDGNYKMKMKLPGLITVTKDINTPQLPSLKDKMKAKKAEIIKWDFSNFEELYSREELGLKGSPTKVKNIEVPPPVSRQGKIWRKENLEQALNTITKICKEKNITGGSSSCENK